MRTFYISYTCLFSFYTARMRKAAIYPRVPQLHHEVDPRTCASVTSQIEVKSTDNCVVIRLLSDFIRACSSVGREAGNAELW